MLKESWIMLRLLCLVINLFFAANLFAQSCPLKDGDLVFIKSQTEQSSLLRYTTGSEWTHVGIAFKKASGWEVIEAVQPVKWTGIGSFVARSKNYSFDVKRPNFVFDSEEIKKFTEKLIKKNYDYIFAWDDERWYCTELVWKAFKAVTGVELGTLERIGDLQHIDSDLIKKEAKRRFSAYGVPYDHEEWKASPVITPIQMMNSHQLDSIGSSEDAAALARCL